MLRILTTFFSTRYFQQCAACSKSKCELSCYGRFLTEGSNGRF